MDRPEASRPSSADDHYGELESQIWGQDMPEPDDAPSPDQIVSELKKGLGELAQIIGQVTQMLMGRLDEIEKAIGAAQQSTPAPSPPEEEPVANA